MPAIARLGMMIVHHVFSLLTILLVLLPCSAIPVSQLEISTSARTITNDISAILSPPEDGVPVALILSKSSPNRNIGIVSRWKQPFQLNALNTEELAKIQGRTKNDLCAPHKYSPNLCTLATRVVEDQSSIEIFIYDSVCKIQNNTGKGDVFRIPIAEHTYGFTITTDATYVPAEVTFSQKSSYSPPSFWWKGVNLDWNPAERNIDGCGNGGTSKQWPYFRMACSIEFQCLGR